VRLSAFRKRYHNELCERLIRIHKSSKKKGDYPNNADGDSKISIKIARGILAQICAEPKYGDISGQSAGTLFEQIIKDYIKQSFEQLQHLRPGNWHYSVNSEISNYEQYADLAEIESSIKQDKKLASTFGQDYIIKSDITIAREPASDEEINQDERILEPEDKVSMLTPFRKSNSDTSRPTLHASISCKWTLRSDRAQNVRTEALNLIRNRKGKLPHIVAVTAEPTLTRIASLALGTGDIDCVYHFALYELINTVREINDESQLDLLEILIEGKRLRDISDLPFDLAV